MNPRTRQRICSTLHPRAISSSSRQLGLGADGAGVAAANAIPARHAASSNPLAPKPPHFAAKAKRVIYLHLTGSPPHLDLFDYKPELVKRNGQDCPDEFLKGKRFAFTTGDAEAAGHAAARSRSTARRASGCPMRCRICTTSPTRCASSTR